MTAPLAPGQDEMIGIVPPLSKEKNHPVEWLKTGVANRTQLLIARF
jgi:hypothetical protein